MESPRKNQNRSITFRKMADDSPTRFSAEENKKKYFTSGQTLLPYTVVFIWFNDRGKREDNLIAAMSSKT